MIECMSHTFDKSESSYEAPTVLCCTKAAAARENELKLEGLEGNRDEIQQWNSVPLIGNLA